MKKSKRNKQVLKEIRDPQSPYNGMMMLNKMVYVKPSTTWSIGYQGQHFVATLPFLYMKKHGNNLYEGAYHMHKKGFSVLDEWSWEELLVLDEQENKHLLIENIAHKMDELLDYMNNFNHNRFPIYERSFIKGEHNRDKFVFYLTKSPTANLHTPMLEFHAFFEGTALVDMYFIVKQHNQEKVELHVEDSPFFKRIEQYFAHRLVSFQQEII